MGAEFRVGEAALLFGRSRDVGERQEMVEERQRERNENQEKVAKTAKTRDRLWAAVEKTEVAGARKRETSVLPISILLATTVSQEPEPTPAVRDGNERAGQAGEQGAEERVGPYPSRGHQQPGRDQGAE